MRNGLRVSVFFAALCAALAWARPSGPPSAPPSQSLLPLPQGRPLRAASANLPRKPRSTQVQEDTEEVHVEPPASLGGVACSSFSQAPAPACSWPGQAPDSRSLSPPR